MRLHDRIVRIEALIEQMRTAADPETRAASLELVQTMMEFHNVGMDRMMEIIADNDAAATTIMDRFAQDPLVSSMLLLHDLHPRRAGDPGCRGSRNRPPLSALSGRQCGTRRSRQPSGSRTPCGKQRHEKCD
jgi:hypothetical protein